MEEEITMDEARNFLRSSDVWGTARLYAVIADGECAGQIVAIKSVQNLERYTYSKVYIKRTTMADIVRPARKGH